MKEEDMNTAEVCWLVFLGGILLVGLMTFLSMLPEMRRYLRLRNM